jgi:hypothetical protein
MKRAELQKEVQAMQLQMLSAFGSSSAPSTRMNQDEAAKMADLLTGEPGDAGRSGGSLRAGGGGGGLAGVGDTRDH